MNPEIHGIFLRRYVKVSLIGLPVLILIFGVGGFLLSWQLLKPLAQLQRTVENVTASGDLKARVTLYQANDELGHLAQSYNAMMTKLEQFFERERSFTRYASHELRNPLTALRVQVDSALAGDTPPEKVLPTLKRELRRLSTILDSLLILSRDQPVSGTLVDLAAVARESIDRARLLVADMPLLIDYQGPNTVVFKGDRALLSRMMDNLLENAVKYGMAGQVLLQLVVKACEIQVQVSDQGMGVPIETLAKLTTPFFRAKQKPGNGVGLGLSVVEQIVKAHSGALSFDNLKPTGFAVMVTFPKPTI
jgi:signal transduction histidine kinase